MAQCSQLSTWLVTIEIVTYWLFMSSVDRFGTQQPSCSYIHFGDCMSMLLKPCILYILTNVAILFHGTIGNDTAGQEKRLAILKRTGHCICLIIEVLFFLMNNIRDTKIFTTLPILKDLFMAKFPLITCPP